MPGPMPDTRPITLVAYSHGMPWLRTLAQHCGDYDNAYALRPIAPDVAAPGDQVKPARQEVTVILSRAIQAAAFWGAQYNETE